MKHSSAELKQMARNNLTGKWGIVIGITLLELLLAWLINIPAYAFASVHTVPGVITYLIITLITGLLGGLISAGGAYFFLNICRGKKYGIGNLFAAFRMHPDRFLIVSLILTAVTLPFQIPVYLVLFTAAPSQTYFITIQLICTILSSVVSMILSLYFAASVYLLLDFPQMGAIQAMKISVRLMRGNKGRYFYLSLSFLGWNFLGLLSCGLGLLWVLPYMNMTFIYFYTDILHQLDPPLPETPEYEH